MELPEWSSHKCPQCGSQLLRDDEMGGLVYCSLTTCDYGVNEDIHENDLKDGDTNV